jgi:phage anti-repressor protein
MKNELIKIENHDGKKAVNARDLHAFLENKQQFTDWIRSRIEKYGLIEEKDYVFFHKFVRKSDNQVGRGRPSEEYALSLDCAKELCMVEQNEKGKEARQYFIECEKRLNKKPFKQLRVERYERLGKSKDWIGERVEGVEIRNEFISTLKTHEVTGGGFAKCTNNIYKPLLGGGAKEVKEERGLTKKDYIRDNLARNELMAVKFAEFLSSDKIEYNNLRGNEVCANACGIASNAVRELIENNKKMIS